MIDDIKNWFLKAKLGKRAQAKNRAVNPLQSGLIIFDATDTNKRKEILEWAKNISKSTSIKFEVLGFINQKKLSPDLKIQFYGSDEISWYGMPKSTSIDNALKKHYDLCIFGDSNILPHQKFILSHLDVSMIAGFHSDNSSESFDFIVEVSSNTSLSRSLDIILASLNKVALK